MINVNYTELKAFIDSGTVKYRHIELSKEYLVIAEDANFMVECRINKTNDEGIDYAANYAANGLLANVHRDDEGREVIYASPRPLDTTTFFSGAGDDTGVADGERMLFSMTDQDAEKHVDLTFSETVYIKDGHFVSRDAPFGAYLSATIRHPVAGEVGSFARMVPVVGSWPIDLNSDDRGKLDQGLILRITVGNANGTDPQDPAAAFKVAGRLEFYRATT
jgi:hypothetical protein